MAWSTVSKLFDFFRDALNDELNNIETTKRKEADESKPKSRRKSKRTSKKSKRSTSAPVKDEDEEPFSPPLTAIDYGVSQAEPKFQFQRVSSVVTIRSAPASPILSVRRKTDVPDGVGKTSSLQLDFDTKLSEEDKVSSRSCDELLQRSFPFSRDKLETMVRSAVTRGELEAVRDDLTKIESSRISDRVKRFVTNSKDEASNSVNIHLFSDDSEVVSPTAGAGSNDEVYCLFGHGGVNQDSAIYDEVYFDMPELEGGTMQDFEAEILPGDHKDRASEVYSDISASKKQNKPQLIVKQAENFSDEAFSDTCLKAKTDECVDDCGRIYADTAFLNSTLGNVVGNLDDDLTSDSLYERIGIQADDACERDDPIYEDVRNGGPPISGTAGSAPPKSDEKSSRDFSKKTGARSNKENVQKPTNDETEEKNETTENDSSKKVLAKPGLSVASISETNQTQKKNRIENFVETSLATLKKNNNKKKKTKKVLRTIITVENVGERQEIFSADDPCFEDLPVHKSKAHSQVPQEHLPWRCDTKEAPGGDHQPEEIQWKSEIKFPNASNAVKLAPGSPEAVGDRQPVSEESLQQIDLQQPNEGSNLHTKLFDDTSASFAADSVNIQEMSKMTSIMNDTLTRKTPANETRVQIGSSTNNDASTLHPSRASTFAECRINDQNILASASGLIDGEVKTNSSSKSFLERNHSLVPSVRVSHRLASSPCRETSNTRYSTADDRSSSQQKEIQGKNLLSVFNQSNNEIPGKKTNFLAVEDRPLTQQQVQDNALRPICEYSNSKFASQQGGNNSDLDATFDLDTYKKFRSEAVQKPRGTSKLDKENQNQRSVTHPLSNNLFVEEHGSSNLDQDLQCARDQVLDGTCMSTEDGVATLRISYSSSQSVRGESQCSLNEVTSTPQTKKQKKFIKKVIKKIKRNASSELMTELQSENVHSQELLTLPGENLKLQDEIVQEAQHKFIEPEIDSSFRIKSSSEPRLKYDDYTRENFPVDAGLVGPKSSGVTTAAQSPGPEASRVDASENKQGGTKSSLVEETGAKARNFSAPSVSESEDRAAAASGHQDSGLASDSKSPIPARARSSIMATTDFILPLQRKVIWSRRVEQQEPKAIPPWAERDAQPPPPPVNHYTSPSSIRFTSHRIPYASRDVPSSTPSTRRQVPQTNDGLLTKQMRMSKSESQINKVAQTGAALIDANIPTSVATHFTANASPNSLPSATAFVSPPNAATAGERRVAETAINTLGERTTCSNEILKLEAQITAGGEGAVGQLAKTSCGSSYCGDTTSGARQSSVFAQTDQAARDPSAGKLLAEMVTVKLGDGKITTKASKMGESPVKGPPAKTVGGKRASGNVKITSGVIRKDDSWRKEGSLKAAQMPPSPRLDSRKYKSDLASSQPVIQQPTIAEQEGELPDAPWRKSPKQQRKPGPTSAQSTGPSEVIPEVLPEATATNVSDQLTKTSFENEIAQFGMSSSVSVTEKTVLKSSSVSEISECATSSKLSESSSSSSLPSSSQVLSNPANLPPHAPIQHKKISISPRGSPKNSPVLPRRGAQITPPPAPPSSSKPSVPCGVSESVSAGTFEAVGKTSLGNGAAAGTDSLRVVRTCESESSDTLVSIDQSPPIVLRNTVVPIPDTLSFDGEEVTKFTSKTAGLSSSSLPVSESVNITKNESISFSESVSEISESTEAIKSVFNAESAQLSSLASPEGANLPPPPLPSSTGENDSVPSPFPAPPPPPPPPTFITESKMSATANVRSAVSATDDYVPVPIMSRILSFEQQSSTEQEMPEERYIPEIKPVGPWVKKTSTGPVSRPEGWVLSPEEDNALPLQTKQQLPKVSQSEEGQLEPQFYYEIASTSSTIQPPPEYDSPHPPATKPHFYQPHQYQSPAQLQQSKEQGSPQFKKQPRKQPSPLQSRKQQPLPQQQPVKQKPQTSLNQQLQQKFLDGESASRPDTRDIQGPSPRPRLGSTSEQINLHYSQAQLMSAPSAPEAEASMEQEPDDGEEPLFDPMCDPQNPRVIQFQDVSAAAFKIKSGIMNTPCTRSNMSASTGVEIFFKKEFNQYTGSFKERGARYTLLSLTPEQRTKGVIAASAGNHALALSYHGQNLGIPVTVVMPLVAPIMKVQACRQYGANILVRGSDIGECRTIALRMARDQQLVYINGYDHPHILAGQGTMGLEMVEQVPNIDAVVVPVGGGGLIAGVALAVKALYPHIQVIGVESENCPSFSAALKNGSPIYTKPESTLADGLAVPLVGVNAFATAASLVDKVVTVREEWIAIAILRLVEQEKAVVEGAGATALAAILAGKLPELKGKRVVIPLCGGNIDTTVLGRCLERGLAADGRLVKFTVTVSDRPGGIAELTRLMASLGVSIKDMTHERAWICSDIFSVEVKVLCETRDHEHYLQLKAELSKRYKIIRFALPDVIHAGTDPCGCNVDL